MKGEASRMATTGRRAMIGMVTPRRMAYLVAWVRMITGAAWLLAPETSARPWVGGAGSDAGGVTLARLIGSRDVVLGVGLLRALRRGRGAREWVVYSNVVRTGTTTWLWVLDPVDATRTRLISRVRMRYLWTSPVILFQLLFDAGDILMMRKCMRGIQRRAEAAA